MERYAYASIWLQGSATLLTSTLSSEFQRQSEENFELSQIYEAQLQENSTENHECTMMYEQEQFGNEMEQD